MTLRPAPRWLVATAAVGVLVTGTTAAVSMQEPAAEASAVLAPTTAPEPPARPVAAQAPLVVAAAVPGVVDPAVPVDVGSEALGPPPGPQADPRPARTAAPADRYAFLVGVQDYRRPTKDTIGSRKDVQFIRQSLLDAGWLPGNVRVVTDAQASGAAIREGMRWLGERSVPGTFTMFHYSGHVKQFGGGTEALWPVDRDFVRDTEVTRLLSAAEGRLWVDVAGCEAGSFLPGLPSDRVLVTASSRADQKSYEYPDWGMSVWTGLLFDLGTKQGQADADRDGRTTMGEATRYATYYAQRITLLQEPHGRQTPQTAGDPVRGWTLADPPA